MDVNNVSFVNDKEREYFARAKLGSDIELFLTSEAGRYLHGRAKIEYQEAQQAVLEHSPDTFWGRRKIRKEQHKAAIAQAFMRWCADAIEDGRNAERELTAQ